MNCNTTHYRANSSSVPGDPTLVLGTREPKNSEEKLQAIESALKGVDIGVRPSFWQPFARSAQSALKEARPASVLRSRYPDRAAALDEAAAKAGRPVANLKFLPIISMKGDWSALLDAGSGELVGFVPLDGFF